MVKFNEFCCGCNLRTGTLIVLWTTLILDGFRVLFYVGKLTYDRSYYIYYEEAIFITTLSDFLFLSACLAGAGIALTGLYGIQKNREDLLNLCYYYYLGYVGYWIFIAIVIIVFPELHFYVSVFSIYHMFSKGEAVRSKYAFFTAYLFTAALCWYFAVTIRSCRENMRKNKITGDFDPEMPDPTTLGYNASL